MKTPNLIHDNILYRFERIATLLIGKKIDDLTEIEREAFHLCRVSGMVIGNFGPDGMDDGVIEEMEHETSL